MYLHLRSSSHKLLRYYARKLLDTYKEPVASAPFLRSVLETTAKAIGYHWAIISAFNQLQKMSEQIAGSLFISKDLEDLFLSYSHMSKADLIPLLLSKSENHRSLEDSIREIKQPPKPRTPTVAKLIGICIFLDGSRGLIIKYVYSIVCDITHAGPVCLALSDLISDPSSDERETGVYRDYAGALADAYPILCLEGLKCSFAVFRKYILDPAPVGRFLPLIERFLSHVGLPKEICNVSYYHIQPFLSGDQPLVFETTKGKVLIYPPPSSVPPLET